MDSVIKTDLPMLPETVNVPKILPTLQAVTDEYQQCKRHLGESLLPATNCASRYNDTH